MQVGRQGTGWQAGDRRGARAGCLDQQEGAVKHSHLRLQALASPEGFAVTICAAEAHSRLHGA